MKTKRIVLLVIGALLVGGAGTAVAVSGISDSGAGTDAEHIPPTDDFAEEVKQSLSAVNGPKSSVGTAKVDIGAQARGANADGARFARTAPAGGNVYLLPAADGSVCLTSDTGLEAGCFGDVTGASASSVICAPGLPPGTIEVFGIAEDGIDKVTVVLEDGTKLPAPVKGNVFIYLADRSAPRPRTVEWDGGETSAAVPSDFREGRCATPADIDKMRRVEPGTPPEVKTLP